MGAILPAAWAWVISIFRDYPGIDGLCSAGVASPEGFSTGLKRGRHECECLLAAVRNAGPRTGSREFDQRPTPAHAWGRAARAVAKGRRSAGQVEGCRLERATGDV